MRLYRVSLDEPEKNIHIIAEDQDHVITILSNIVGSVDYISLVKIARIVQVAGPVGNDALNFYWGL